MTCIVSLQFLRPPVASSPVLTGTPAVRLFVEFIDRPRYKERVSLVFISMYAAKSDGPTMEKQSSATW